MKYIKTDEELVTIINDLKHYLKAGIPYSPMRGEFNDMLSEFIARHRLDTEPHFECGTCGLEVPWSDGGADEFPDDCSKCWLKKTNERTQQVEAAVTKEG